MLLNILKAIRIKHWLKNGLVFLPIIFSGQLFDPTMLLSSFEAFLSFSFMASTIYLINDIKDKEKDANHPTKRERPIASGALSTKAASIIAVILFVFSCAICVAFSTEKLLSISTILCYGLLNIAYSLKLKNIPVIDVTILSLGFIFRVFFGGFFCGVVVSQWMCLSILAISFFFGLGKRRGELKLYGSSMRQSLEAYSMGFLDKSMYVFVSLGLVFFSLWLFDRISEMGSYYIPIALSLCVILTIVILLRYCLDIESDSSDGDPVEVVFSDKPLLAFVFVWLVFIIVLLYVIV